MPEATVADHGRGTNLLGGPVSALRHLVDILSRDQVNPPLAAGEIVTTGTLTRALPVFVLVPAKIAKLFQQILLEVASGHAVSIVPHERMLSTQDAADFLHISRPYLIKLLGEERVEIQKVGNRRRIAFGEVLKLKEKLRRRSDTISRPKFLTPSSCIRKRKIRSRF